MRSLALLGLALGAVALPASAQPPAGTPPAPPTEPAPAGPGPTEEAEGSVGGEIRTEGGRAEILPEPPPVGRTVNTPEGWYRVEAGPSRDDGATGSFSVVAPALLAPPAPTAPAAPGARTAAAPEDEAGGELALVAEAAEDPCRDEKDRYLARLLESLEIDDVEEPLALLQGIEELPAGTGLGPFVRLSLFGLPAAGPVAVDPIRPLAWDLELRSIARDLAGCVRAGRGR